MSLVGGWWIPEILECFFFSASLYSSKYKLEICASERVTEMKWDTLKTSLVLPVPYRGGLIQNATLNLKLHLTLFWLPPHPESLRHGRLVSILPHKCSQQPQKSWSLQAEWLSCNEWNWMKQNYCHNVEKLERTWRETSKMSFSSLSAINNYLEMNVISYFTT